MKSIHEAKNLKGKRVLVRVDWSVPTHNGRVINDYQIRASFPTIHYLREAGAKIVLLSHAEKGESDNESLLPIFEYVRDLLPLTFIETSDLMLMENVRQNPGEKENSKEFAKELSKLGDIFVNEAFSESHREYASIVGVPEYLPSYAGLRLELEVKELSKAFYPKRPFLFIIGGAKFDTKLPLLKKFTDIADYVFVGGALANNFFKEQGKEIGKSLIKDGEYGLAKLLKSGKIILPEDVIEDGGRILDAGAITMEKLKDKIANSRLVLWNGPLGLYEIGYKVATLQLAKMISELAHESIIGGGDTLAAIKELNIQDKFSFVSTGGGAMITFLAKGTLPGIEALSKR